MLAKSLGADPVKINLLTIHKVDSCQPSLPVCLTFGEITRLHMAYWLIKSEPEVYSWDDLKKDKKTRWDGIRNYAARNHLKSMKKGDEILFYHSNKGTEIVGIATVVTEAYPDPTASEPAWFAVDIKPARALARPVPLAKIKEEKKLAQMALVRIGRLSVQPVSSDEWMVIMAMGGMDSKI